MAFDAAYLHAMVFSTRAFFVLMLSRRNGSTATSSGVSQRTSLHFSKAVRILRERILLGDETEKVSFPTVTVVLMLASHAHMMGDQKSARLHMEGLYKIVNLRGGIHTFRDHSKLMIELLRYSPIDQMHS